VILTLPYYDPTGQLNASLRRQLATLQAAFTALCFNVVADTAECNGEAIGELAAQGCAVHKCPPGASIGDQSRAALRLALTRPATDGSIFFGFLNRVLFALETEHRAVFLHDLSTAPAHDLLLYERSPAAWDTHPKNYREIEGMASRMFEVLSGRRLELMPCALLLSRDAAAAVLAESTNASHAVWAEWLLLAMKAGIPITTRGVDWLAWQVAHWEGGDADLLRRAREHSRDEFVKRVRMNVPVMLLLTEERFASLARG